MINLKYSVCIFLICLLFPIACTSRSETPVLSVTQTPGPQATATLLPTPFPPGSTILWGNLQVTMDRLEITDEFLTDFGSTRNPSPGNKFLWVHIGLKNTGEIEVNIPVFEHYSILYAATEIKPIYGHRAEYVDYTSMGSTIFPGQAMDGWLRFDIPAIAELKDMLFVFIPESAQVGTSFSSPNYPYSDDKPTYVWNCEQ